MVRFEVITYNGQPPLVDQACEFGDAGGNIGRADGNAMVLPDPERLISRVHASVTLRGNDFFIRDLSSSNPLIVNGTSLGNGRESILRTGDEVSIGAYVLRVSVPGMERIAAGASAAPRPDSLLPGGDEPSSDNPFADLIAPLSPTAPARARVEPVEPPRVAAKRQSSSTPAAETPPRFIPDDFDPFAPPPAAASGPQKLPDDLDLGIEGFKDKRSLEEMFDLRPASAADPRPLPAGSDTTLGGVPIEPLQAIGAVHAAPLAEEAQRDDAPEMFASFRMPNATIDPASELARAPAIEPVPQATPPKKESPPTPARAIPIAEIGSTPDPSRAPVSAPDELLREFLAGAGVPNVQIPAGLTPKLMNTIGQLLRESTSGTLDLLRARALLKHEMRAAMTMMAEKENNPLKFSPNIDAAMTHLLSPAQGFMTPVRAMKDAYGDLRAHEIAFMAGMRAALSGVLARFKPEELEPRLSESSLMDKILPVNRRAKRWDVFVALYEQLSREAEDDFHTLFGKEFLRAYAAQIARFEQKENVRD